MQIKGKDDDQAGTINAEISYSIISQEPEGTNHMFTIDEKTGKLYVKEPTLDREVSVLYINSYTQLQLFLTSKMTMMTNIEFLFNLPIQFNH